MSPLSVIALSVLLLGSANSQEEIPQPPLYLSPGFGDSWNADWEGVGNRVYFLQCSFDLIDWMYAPLVEFGLGSKSLGADSSGTSRLFLRLAYGNDFTILDLNDAWNADSDYDGIPNFWELQNGTSPLAPQTGDDFLTKHLAQSAASTAFEVSTPLQ